jgi:hypothetical protein
MAHGDNKGLAIPPRIASKHAVIVPITLAPQSAVDCAAVSAQERKFPAELTAAGVPVAS